MKYSNFINKIKLNEGFITGGSYIVNESSGSKPLNEGKLLSIKHPIHRVFNNVWGHTQSIYGHFGGVPTKELNSFKKHLVKNEFVPSMDGNIFHYKGKNKNSHTIKINPEATEMGWNPKKKVRIKLHQIHGYST